MPTTYHIERHSTAWKLVWDIVIGMSDGLTLAALFCFGYIKGHFTDTNPPACLDS